MSGALEGGRFVFDNTEDVSISGLDDPSKFEASRDAQSKQQGPQSAEQTKDNILQEGSSHRAEPTSQDVEEFERTAQDSPEKFWAEDSSKTEEDLILPKVEAEIASNLNQRHVDMPSDASMPSLRYDPQTCFN